MLCGLREQYTYAMVFLSEACHAWQVRYLMRGINSEKLGKFISVNGRVKF